MTNDNIDLPSLEVTIPANNTPTVSIHPQQVDLAEGGGSYGLEVRVKPSPVDTVIVDP